MRALTVTEFLHGVNDVLASVPALVEGEVSTFSVNQGKWAFFSLKDDASTVSCFMPVWRLQHEVEPGMLVRVAGVPKVYERSGKFSIVVEALTPAGEGSLRRAFELLVAKLEAEGLFAAERKRAIPRFPERVGLVASGDSAAYSDFIRILTNRWGGIQVFHTDVAVQGMSAVSDIITAFTALKAIQPALDAIILTRGGGSLEDLQAFNSEEVARALFASTIPVMVGVGHERDVTIADLVADVRASTPSNAAERLVPTREDIVFAVETSTATMARGVERAREAPLQAIVRFFDRGAMFTRGRVHRIDRAVEGVGVRMHALLTGAGQRWGHAVQQMDGRWTFVAARASDRLVAARRLLENLNPTKLLTRGYSMTVARGRVVRDVADVASGDVLTTTFGRGSAQSTVTATTDS